MKIRIPALILVFITLALTAPSFVCAKAPSGKKTHKTGPALNATSLVKEMKEAVAYIAMHGKKELNPKSKLEKPFWSGLKAVDQDIKKVEEGLKAKDAGFIKSLNKMGGNLAELDTGWAMLKREAKHKDSKISHGLASLNKAYALMNNNYGPTAGRLKKGGDLTEKEKNQVAHVQAEEKKLLAKLQTIKGKAPAKSMQARMTQDVIRKCERISHETVNDVATYVKLMEDLAKLEDEIYGYNKCIAVWEPTYYAEWKVVEEDIKVVETIYYEENWSEYEDWSATETTITEYGDYYDHDVQLSSEETSEYEEFAEEYNEESAVEDSAEEEAELDEEMEDGGDDAEDFADEGDDDGGDDDGGEE